jgi:hypothetical protein
MFPNSHDRPSGGGQCAFVFEITSAGGLQLACPPLGVGLREGGVLGAPVPKASVDEHGYMWARKDDVGLAAESGDRPAVLEEAQARAVKGRP